MGEPTLLDTIKTETRAYLEEENTKALTGIRETISELRKPKTEDAEVLDSGKHAERKPAYGTAARQTHRRLDPMYRHMSDEELRYRNPDGDHWAAEWIRAEVRKDRAGMGRAIDGIMSVFDCDRASAQGLGRNDRAVTEGAPTAGVYAGEAGPFIPLPIAQTALIARENGGIFRRIVTNVQMGSTPLRIPTVAAITAVMAPESVGGGEGDDAEPTTSSVVLDAQKMRVHIDITEESLADTSTNLITVFAQRAGMAFAALEDTQIGITGGGGAPNIGGIWGGTAYVEDTITVMTFADVLQMMNLVGNAYITNSVWVMGAAFLEGLFSIDRGDGVPLALHPQQDATNIGQNRGPARGNFMGHPLYIAPIVAGAAIFGDPRSYWLGTRSGIQFSSSDGPGFMTDTVSTKWIARVAGNDVDPAGAQRVAGITSWA